MKRLTEILVTQETLTIDELESQSRERDEECARIQQERALLRALLDRRYVAQQAAAADAAPANLTQRLQIGRQ